MTEIRGYDKQVLRVCQIRAEYLPILLLALVTRCPHHHWNDGEVASLALHHLGNVWQVHLYAVFLLVNLLTHHFKLACCTQL